MEIYTFLKTVYRVKRDWYNITSALAKYDHYFKSKPPLPNRVRRRIYIFEIELDQTPSLRTILSFIDQSSSLPLSSAGVHDAVPKEMILAYTHHKLTQEFARPAVVRKLEVEIASMELVVVQAAVDVVGRSVLAALGAVA